MAEDKAEGKAEADPAEAERKAEVGPAFGQVVVFVVVVRSASRGLAESKAYPDAAASAMVWLQQALKSVDKLPSPEAQAHGSQVG